MKNKVRDAKKKPFTLKGDFEPSTRAERDFYRALKKIAQVSGAIVEAHVEEGGRLRNITSMDRALRDYAKLIEPWARRQSARLLAQVSKSNQKAYQAKSKLIGTAIKEGIGARNTREAAFALMEEQVALIKSIPIEAGLRAQKIALESVLSGTRAAVNQDTVKELEKELGLTTEVATSRARLIARTETARASAAMNEARATAVGSTHYRWRNSGDGAVRESHRVYQGKKLDGRVFSWANPPTLSDGMTGHPGTFPNCFPGESKLTGSPLIEKLYRRRYFGESTILTLDDGTVLSATPNHPILTPNGPLSIKELNVGQYALAQFSHGVDSVHADVKRFNISFEQLFDAAMKSGVFVKSSAAGGEFHGDRSDEEVDIISLERGLVDELNAATSKKLFELDLPGPDEGFWNELVSGFGSESKLRAGNNPSSSRSMGRIENLYPLIRAHLTPLELFGLAARPHINTRSDQVLSNNCWGDSEVFSDLIFAYTLLVHGFDFLDVQVNRHRIGGSALSGRSVYARTPEMFTDYVRMHLNGSGNLDEGLAIPYQFKRVVKKSVGHFDVHVFNLQTVSGYYAVHSVFGNNCRCYAEPILGEE